MSMLADPKKKKRYNLVPRGKALYEDKNRFGTKMLKKMGWKEGTGLGANEDGSKDFVRVRYKNDAEGLGYEDRDDQWTQHQSEFSGLLQSLNGQDDKNDGPAGAAGDEAIGGLGLGCSKSDTSGKGKLQLKDKASGESLEELSKKSRARVHYKKFTRGKDLSLYSEKDLANIFGKKAGEQEDDADAEQSVTVEEEKKAPEKEVPANFAGVSTFSSSLSVGEYFKHKMECLKNKLFKSTENSKHKKQAEKALKENEHESTVGVGDEQIEGAKKKKKKDKKSRSEESKIDVAASIVETETEIKKKKKDKKPNDDDKVPTKQTDGPAVAETESEIKLKKHKHLEEVREGLEAAICETDNIRVMQMKILEQNAKQSENVADANVCDSKNKQTKTKRESRKRYRVDFVSKEKKMSGAHDEKDIDTTEMETDTNAPSSTKPSGSINLTDLQDQYDECNVYRISKYTADKFASFDFAGFQGANLSSIDGYGFDENTKLEVVETDGHEDRIRHFWDETLDKYKYATPKYEYVKFAEKARVAYKTKGRVPKFNVKSLKRKNAFLTE